MSARLIRSLMILVVPAALLVPATASESAKHGNLTRISGESPFEEDCNPFLALEPSVENAEAEVTLAVNPSNPENMIAAWMQDDVAGIVTTVTNDGGRIWSKPPGFQPGVSLCSGGDFVAAADPWLSIGLDNREGRPKDATVAYLASFSLGPERTRLQVSTSDDGGETWSNPLFPFGGTVFGGALTAHDKPAVTAHPTEPCVAYVVWVEQAHIAVTPNTAIMFSRTDDCGRTWLPVPIPAIPRDSQRGVWAPEVLVLPRTDSNPDGSLLLMANMTPGVNGSALPDEEDRRHEIVVSRSANGGLIWSHPVPVAQFTGPLGFEDPKDSERCEDPQNPDTCENIKTQHEMVSADIAPDGTVHIAFHDETKDGEHQIQVVSSTDATAEKWATPVVVSEGTAQKFLPAIAVAGDGTVGVTYYDLRDDELGDELTTDVFFAFSRDGGLKWQEQHLAGPFDMRTSTQSLASAGFWVGEYHGLDGLPHGFAAAFALAEPFTTAGATDVFFARIEPNHAPICSRVTAAPSVIAPATRDQLHAIVLSGASDPDGDPLSFHIDGVSQDEPVTGEGIGDDTSPDAQFTAAGADSNQVLVRAERNPQRNGRVYRIAYTVSDDLGAGCSGTAGVGGDTSAEASVPRKTGEVAVDDGDTNSWNSFTGEEVLGTLP